MFENAPSVPFQLDENTHGGFSEVKGLLSLDGDYLVIEYRPVFLGLFKMAMKEIDIPLADIRSMTFDSKLFGAYNRLTIRTRTQSVLEGFPGASQGRLRMTIKRVDREEADELADLVEIRAGGSR